MSQQIIGFVVTPEELANRVTALDNAVRALDRQVDASKAPRLNVPWRSEWDAFQRRWAVARDSFASWGSRLFATRVQPILEEFERSYRWWARDFQRRTGVSAEGAKPVEQTGLVPSWAYLLAAAAIAAVVLKKGGVF